MDLNLCFKCTDIFIRAYKSQEMLHRFTLLILIVLFSGLSLKAQLQENNKLNILAINITYASQWPAVDMKDRFGNNLEIGLGLDYITKEKNYIFGITGNFHFGNKVNENTLESIENDDGNIVGVDQAAAIVSLKQRGLYAGLHIGKIFQISGSNARSGLRVTIGAGLLQHKIRLQDDLQTVNLLKGDYRKGFDRLSNGLAFHQFIGYELFSNNRLLNFLIGVECYEAFTKSRRSYDYGSMSVDTKERFDILFGVKAGWILPLYLNFDPDEIYY